MFSPLPGRSNVRRRLLIFPPRLNDNLLAPAQIRLHRLGFCILQIVICF